VRKTPPRGPKTHFSDPVCRQDDLRSGSLIGEDKYGNKYFENNAFFYGELVLLLWFCEVN